MDKKVQNAANKKANQLLKSFGNTQLGFEKTWKAIEILFPSADIQVAIEYAVNLANKR